MGLNATCPLTGILTSVPETSCPIVYGQIQKLVLQPIQSTPTFTAQTINLKATWDALLAETDETKVVATPMLMNCIVPASELTTEGGNDNTTINGIRNVRGLNAVTATAQMSNISSATKTAVQALFSYSKYPMPGLTHLWAYILLHDGRVVSNADFTGIPVYNLALTDPALEGYNKDNVFNFSWDMIGGWSDTIVATSTNFKPYQLVNPS